MVKGRHLLGMWLPCKPSAFVRCECRPAERSNVARGIDDFDIDPDCRVTADHAGNPVSAVGQAEAWRRQCLTERDQRRVAWAFMNINASGIDAKLGSQHRAQQDAAQHELALPQRPDKVRQAAPFVRPQRSDSPLHLLFSDAVGMRQRHRRGDGSIRLICRRS